jgi:hypothetical protein
MDSLKDRVETDLVYRVFSMKVPMKYWDDFYVKADKFFKDYYGDVRWVGLSNMIDAIEQDIKYHMMFEEIEDLKLRIAELEETPKKGVNLNQAPKTFGMKKGD